MEPQTGEPKSGDGELLTLRHVAEEEERQRFRTFLTAGAYATFGMSLVLLLVKGWLPAALGAACGGLQLVARYYGSRPKSKVLLRWLNQIVLSGYLLVIVGLSLITGQGQSFVLWFLVLLPVMGAFVNTPPIGGLWAAIATLASVGVSLSGYWTTFAERLFTTPELRSVTRVALILIVAAISIRVRQTSDHRIRELSQSLHRENQSRLVAERLQQEADKARLAAEAADQAKTRVLAFMSHEIRTPLSGVLGLNALLRETPLTPEQARFVDLARHSGEILLSLINDFLDLSRLDANHLELESAAFDPCLLVQDRVTILQETARKKGLLLTCECRAPRGVRGDQTRAGQVLLNLMGNAIKFTHEGSIVLRCLECGRAPGQVWLRFEVEDTGIGIPAAIQHTLFQPFVQADSSTTRRYGGTGLGLAICKSLTEVMGGRIGLDSEPGKGSLFWVELPFGEVPEVEWPALAERSFQASVEVPGGAVVTGRVLVVEDNPVNQLLAVEMLERLGYRVDVVSNGQEAVEAVRQLPFDLVLMDCDMPVMDGFEASRTIRLGEPPDRHLPIVAMTAAAMPGDRDRCLEAGMDDYLSKPVRLADLRQTVARWIGKAEGAA